MKDKTMLHILTIIGVGGWALLFRKGSIKDWVIVYLCKTMVSTLIDSPVTKKKYVNYPKRYLPNLFDSNITFVYLIFPIACILYNQYTYNMSKIKTILSVIFFSVPITILEGWLEKNTQLVKYSKGWNAFHTLFTFTLTFWLVRAFMAGVRFVDQKRTTSQLVNETE